MNAQAVKKYNCANNDTLEVSREMIFSTSGQFVFLASDRVGLNIFKTTTYTKLRAVAYTSGRKEKRTVLNLV